MSALARATLRMGSSIKSPQSLTAAKRLATVSRHMSTSPEGSLIAYESQGSTALYRLNREKALNALNHEMITSLSEQARSWQTSDSVKMVIGTGKGRAFCAGGDVKQLVLDLKEGKNTALPFFKDEFELNWLLARLGKPYVSIMDGITMGGGCGIALPAPIRIGTPRTLFAMPETKIGYSPDVGVIYYLAQLDGNIGAWLAITGQTIGGRAAYELGLVTHYISEGKVEEVLRALYSLEQPDYQSISTTITSAGPQSPDSSGGSVVKGDIRRFLDKAFGKATLKEVYQTLAGAEQDESLSADVKKWAKEQQDFMDQRSPTGMAVAFESFRRAKKTKKLDEVLKNDMKMASAFAGLVRPTDDFIIGGDAVLVQKTKERPNFASSIDDPALSSKENLEKYFGSKDQAPNDSTPTLNFRPAPSQSSGSHDSTWGRFRQFGLPSEREVEAIVEGSAPGSGAFKLKEKELIERVLEARGEQSGERAQEITEWVGNVVRRLCEVKEDGYLDWKSAEK